ncbi:MAG: PKD domain-containing protein [Bacteroidetes bacterium]|nr:PKD domain-containing protein [Bacteroidota bacterium]
MKKILIIPFFIFLFSACKKKELPDSQSQNNPQFYIKANVNGAPINIVAGQNDYYMYSSHFQNQNNVYTYKSNIKLNCSNCSGYSFTLLINDFKVSQPNATMIVDSSIYTGNYYYSGANLPPLYATCSFTADYTNQLTSYNWLFSDASTSTNSCVVKNISSRYPYTVQLITSSYAAAPALLKTINILSPLQGNVEASFDTLNHQLRCSLAANLTQTVSNYSWDFGDGSPQSTLSNPVHIYANQGYYPVKLKVWNTANDTNYFSYQATIFKSPQPNSNFKINLTKVPNTFSLSAITLQLTDPNGNIYTSDATAQPESSYFTISDVNDYQPNELGDKTKKIKILFNCTLQNGTNNIIISNGEAVVAVSYK